MAIHNEPGRGRKQCQNCQKYVGVRSHVCPNCSKVFGTSLPIFREKVVPSIQKIVPTVAKEKEPKTEKAEDDAKGSRISRIARLKEELIRELRNSSRSYSAGIVKEISDKVLLDSWE